MTAQDWSLVVADRDGTVRETFQAGDDPDEAPVVDSNGQDSLFDVGAGELVLPLSSEKLDSMVENRLLHVKSSGQTVTSCVIGAIREEVIRPVNGNATVDLRSLVDVLNEGFVWPTRGFNVEPAGQEQHYDWSHPARDNGDFEAVDVQGTVTDARSAYPDTYGDGFSFPDDVQVVGPPGYTFGTTDSHDGWCFYYRDWEFSETARYRIRLATDNALDTARFDSVEILPKTWGYARALEVDIDVVAGTHRIAATVYNPFDLVLGPPHGVGTTNLAVEVIKLTGGGSEDVLELVTDGDWQILSFPDPDVYNDGPGMTFTQVARIQLEEMQFLGFLSDVTLDPTVDDFTDSNGAPIEQQWNITTRACQPLGDFWLHEMGRYFADIKVVADEDAGGFVWFLYSLGGRGDFVAATIDPDDVVEMAVTRERTAATSLIVEYKLGFTMIETAPPDGQPKRAAFLSLGAQDRFAQVAAIAGAELGDFSRQRIKLAVTDKNADGRGYWTADSIDSLPVDRDMTLDGARVKSMTWRIDENGEMEFTPEFFDIIVPVPARAANAMSRMGPGSLRGRSSVPRRV